MKSIYSFILLFFVSLLFGQNSDLGFWKFDGDLKDNSSVDNNANLTGGPVFVEGRTSDNDSALYFDGINDGLTIAHFPEFNRDTLTISMWVKPENSILEDHPSFTYRIEWLLFKGTSTTPSASTHQLNMSQQDGELDKLGISSTKISSNQQYFNVLEDSIKPNKWHNIVSVLQGKNHYLYVDGELVGESIMDAFVSKNTDPISIAHIPNKSDRFYKGAIDDLKISPTAWTQADVYDEFGVDYCEHIIYDTVTVINAITILDTVTVMDTLIIDFDDPILFASENELSGTVKVYPNPTSDEVTLDFSTFAESTPHKIKIINSLSQPVFENYIHSDVLEIPLIDLGGEGTYYLIIKDEEGDIKVTKKIIVQ